MQNVDESQIDTVSISDAVEKILIPLNQLIERNPGLVSLVNFLNTSIFNELKLDDLETVDKGSIVESINSLRAELLQVYQDEMTSIYDGVIVNVIQTQVIDIAQSATELARAWAESDTSPDPENPDSKSSKTWALEAAFERANQLWYIDDDVTSVTIGIAESLVISDPGPGPYDTVTIEVP